MTEEEYLFHRTERKGESIQAAMFNLNRSGLPFTTTPKNSGFPRIVHFREHGKQAVDFFPKSGRWILPECSTRRGMIPCWEGDSIKFLTWYRS